MTVSGRVYHYGYEDKHREKGKKKYLGKKRRRQMKVLVACEESQEVCKAFRARGHEAYSCDIQEPSGGHPEWHILGDALKAIKGGGKS